MGLDGPHHQLLEPSAIPKLDSHLSESERCGSVLWDWAVIYRARVGFRLRVGRLGDQVEEASW